jgi:hypothetical protein
MSYNFVTEEYTLNVIRYQNGIRIILLAEALCLFRVLKPTRSDRKSKLDRDVTRWLLTQGATAIRRETAAQHMTHAPVLAGHCEKSVGWQ